MHDNSNLIRNPNIDLIDKVRFVCEKDHIMTRKLWVTWNHVVCGNREI